MSEEKIDWYSAGEKCISVSYCKGCRISVNPPCICKICAKSNGCDFKPSFSCEMFEIIDENERKSEHD